MKFNEILKQEVTRKQFLSIVGFGVITVLGFSSIISMFSSSKQKNPLDIGNAYGPRAYGRQNLQ
jgi:hypothetical protein